ncbi:MAG: hypothetical protein WD075_11565 [Rhodospirillales bacterium]
MPPEDYLRRSPIRFDEANYQVCYEYWQRLKGQRKSPKWSEWDWFEIPVRLIPYFLVVDVIHETAEAPRDYVYRFWGTASVTMHNFDFTNLSIRKIRSPETAMQTARQYDEVVETHEALGSAYTVQAGVDGLPYVQTSLRLPFSSDGETVDQIATYCDWSRDMLKIRDDHIRAFGERPG